MFTLVFWFPPTLKSKVQYFVGMVIYFIVGPFLTITVLLYALYHLDHFSWGKTRMVILDDETVVDNDSTGSGGDFSTTPETVTETPR